MKENHYPMIFRYPKIHHNFRGFSTTISSIISTVIPLVLVSDYFFVVSVFHVYSVVFPLSISFTYFITMEKAC